MQFFHWKFNFFPLPTHINTCYSCITLLGTTWHHFEKKNSFIYCPIFPFFLIQITFTLSLLVIFRILKEFKIVVNSIEIQQQCRQANSELFPRLILISNSNEFTQPKRKKKFVLLQIVNWRKYKRIRISAEYWVFVKTKEEREKKHTK